MAAADSKKKYVWGFLSVGVLLLLFLIFLNTNDEHWWIRDSHVTVSVNGQASRGTAYRNSSDPQVFVEVDGDGIYIVEPQTKRVSRPNGTNVPHLLGRLFVMHPDQGGVFLESAKMDYDPQIQGNNHQIAFTTPKRNRVVIIW